MRIGVPREVKNHEYRVAITPVGVHGDCQKVGVSGPTRPA
jgi:alanine dehydrogenase